ncbi:hypothetical protein PIB30_003427 [Stylosanthes scabra]|uniref:C2H2-type domain-containing protein n=1 Tax=Stylosanthes scabra TaxID=79078 RepID=A0ABU6U469_9FABA|nr:hypothetical protein [Stylosanthes scabra]
MTDPSAEVVALSPTTLMATNRFVCEICNKGFQRDQNLQLHRRGHNLPWKLRQRTSTEVKKRVYVCPEPSCVHHNPARALGDLTGIKKHYSRKHGEKKWKCDKCSKRYAVQSDWKAHQKTCGTREYKCDCGTIFSRRDSFITHRAFCDALTEENNRVSNNLHHQGLTSGMPPSLQSSQINNPLNTITNNNSPDQFITDYVHSPSFKSLPLPQELIIQTSSSSPFNNKSMSSNSCSSSALQLSSSGFNNVLLSAAAAAVSSSSSSAHMSATALLQKAAQMGATASNNSMNSPMMQKSFSMGTTTMAGPDHATVVTTRPSPPPPPPYSGAIHEYHHHHHHQPNIAGVSGGGAFTNQLLQKEIVSQLFDANTSSTSNNDMGMYGQMFMATATTTEHSNHNNNNGGLMKISGNNVEQDVSTTTSSGLIIHARDSDNNNNNTIMAEASRFGGGGGGGSDDDIATVHDFLGIGGGSIGSTGAATATLNQQRLQIMNHFHHHIPHHAADSAMDKTMWDV